MAEVLIIEDSSLQQKILTQYLNLFGHNVCATATSGEIGIEYYKTFRPDLVTVDLIMPGMNGIETIKKLKKIDPRVRIAVISAMSGKKMVQKAIKAGAIQYIMKPFKMLKFKSIVGDLLGKNSEEFEFKTLVIEDSQVVSGILEQCLTKLGHYVCGKAANSLEGIEMFKMHQPDFVTVDLNMPGMNGIEAAKRILAIDSSAVIILISSAITDDVKDEARLAGIKYFMHKPFTATKFLNIFKKIIEIE